MNPSRLFTLPITITHVEPDPSTPDDFGNPGQTTTTTTKYGDLQQTRRAEDTAGGDVQDETFSLFIEPDADLEGADSITAAGQTYQLAGPAWEARNPRTGDVTHIEATVRRTV